MARVRLISLFALIILSLASAALAQDMNIKGWEADGEYNKLYDNSERDSFKGRLLDIVDLDMDGMAPGIAIVVRDRTDGEDVLCHLGPADFVKPRIEALHEGDTVKVYGVWAEMDDEDIFIAAKVKTKGERKVKMRLTKDGKPFWTLSPEELAKEESQ